MHAILAVREVVNNGDGTGQMRGISLLTAFCLVLVSIAVLVVYVHHIGQSLRVSSLIELVGKETPRRKTLLPARGSRLVRIPMLHLASRPAGECDLSRMVTRGLFERARIAVSNGGGVSRADLHQAGGWLAHQLTQPPMAPRRSFVLSALSGRPTATEGSKSTALDGIKPRCRSLGRQHIELGRQSDNDLAV